MFRKLASRTSFVLLAVISGLFISCRSDEPQNPSEEPEPVSEWAVVYETDSTEWRVKIFKEHLLYSEAVETNLPAPWRLPTKEEAQFLRTLTFSDSKERFITSDGYTFLMPSASVTKAGEKTKYSILGLYIRRSAIIVEF